MTARPARRLTPGWALVLLGTTLAWAFSYISIDRATTPPASPGTTALDAYQLAFWRNAIAAAVYLPVVAWFATRRGLPPLPAIRANLGLGALQYGIGILCFYWAIAHGNLLINGLLNGLFPVLLAITARLLGDPMDRRAWPWIGLSFLGTAVLVWGNQRSMDIRPGEAVLVPSLVMLAANVLLAFASIRSRHYAERY
ncbi:MAG TPA: DMT family transporter, partial [bacterium]|nr:DMT family transporter [bacterium]